MIVKGCLGLLARDDLKNQKSQLQACSAHEKIAKSLSFHC